MDTRKSLSKCHSGQPGFGVGMVAVRQAARRPSPKGIAAAFRCNAALVAPYGLELALPVSTNS
jgi:hypothetical protein